MSLAVRITLLRQLTRVDLARFGPKLAEALVTRSQQVKIRRSFVSRRTAAADEAVALYRRLVRDRPGRHEVGLARALVAQGSVPDDRTVGSALAQGREAIGYVENATDRDGLVVLAAARLMVAMQLRSDAPRDALPLADQARETWLRCAPLGARERMELARSLTVLGYCRTVLGEPAEALAAREEAVELFRRLSFWTRLKYMPARLEAMSGLADSLASHRRFAEALTLATGAREDLTFMSRVEPLRFRPTLGNLLFVIARCHLGLREQDAAVAAAEEAVGHYRWLAEHDPVRYQSRLVVALRSQASVFTGLGRYEKAAWATAEAEAMESR
ncbi:hypothetical protein PSN13_06312 [Micromonospora saelicesensis]|uniref:Tetratricopeptide repeat-containing protein n=1 Tax=Micromonospora saelicesensis TaxID=285676 RepID=A0A328NC72_9ACTN|nr:hypothetical protein [Micromonospora saelicesensis]RAO26288.1 hypothetical protein PSN13_06312 [Micromonospora saelicesensis]